MLRYQYFWIGLILIALGYWPGSILAQENEYALSNGFITAGSRAQMGIGNMTFAMTIGQPVVANMAGATDPEGLPSHGLGLGIWSFFQLQPMSPFVFASDGDYGDHVEVTWAFDPLSPPPDDGFKIYRNGSHLATLQGTDEAYQDFNVYAGQVYNYGVRGLNEYGDGGFSADPGFVNPNGVITGQVVSQNNRPIADVKTTLSPSLGRALSFDSALGDYIETPILYHQPAQPTQLTVEAWLKCDSLSVHTTYNDQTGNYSAVYHGKNGEFDFRSNMFAVKLVDSNWYSAHIDQPPVGEWYHLAGTWQRGDSLSIFLNGTLIERIAVPDAALFNPDTTYSGCGIGAKNRDRAYFPGEIDDVRIWTTVRPAENIQRDLNRTLSGSEADLLAYWKFDEGTSNKVFDLTDNNFHGAIIGAEWTDDTAPVQNSGFTNSSGNYMITGIFYGEGTTFHVIPEKIVPMGRSVELDGVDDYLEINNVATFMADSTVFSVEAWIKPNVAVAQQAICAVNDAAGNDLFGIFYTGRIKVGNPGFEIESEPISPNEWHHLAYVRHGTAATLYVDDLGGVSHTPNYVFQQGDQWSIGQEFDGANPSDFFHGNIDEIRLWNIARTADEIRDNRERVFETAVDGLAAYWRCNDGRSDILVDEMSNQSSGTLIDPDGNFDDNWSEDVPFSEAVVHEFNPEERLVTLDPSNTSTDQVNFTDLTTVPVSGFVRYNGITCFVEDVEIRVDGESADPRVFTNANGEFIIEFEPGASHQISASYKNHLLTPLVWEVENVTAPVSGLVFLDHTQRDLTVNVYGGTPECRISLVPSSGNLNVNVGTTPTCFEANQNITSGTSITFSGLPAANFVVSVNHPDGNINFDSLPIDLTEGDGVLDFAYHAPIQVEIISLDGFIPDSCESGIAVAGDPNTVIDPPIPILNQDAFYSLNFEIYEDYAPYGSTCPVDTGFINIYNALADQDTTLTFGNGHYDGYLFRADEPNILSGGDHPYQKSIQAVGYELVLNENNDTWIPARSGHTTTWAIVLGERIRGQQFVTLRTDPYPHFILRDPPGDRSYSYLIEEVGVSKTQQFMWYDNQSLSWETFSYLGPDVGLTVPFTGIQLFSDFDVDIYSQMEIVLEQVSQKNWRIRLNMQESYTTSPEPTNFVAGENLGDVFVGMGYNLSVTDADKLEFDDCVLSLSTTPVINEVEVYSSYIYSENHIKNTLITDLIHLRNEAQTAADSTRFEEEIFAWVSLLLYNADSLKTYDEADYVRSISFDGGLGGYGYSETVSKHSFESVNTYVTAMSDGSIYLGNNVNGVGTGDRLMVSTVATMAFPLLVEGNSDDAEYLAYFDGSGYDDNTLTNFYASLGTLQDVLSYAVTGAQIFASLQTAGTSWYGAIKKTLQMSRLNIMAGWEASHIVDNWQDSDYGNYIVETDTTTTSGYYLNDDDPGDFFWVKVYHDGVYGLYFELEAGATKCPWEAGSARREDTALSASSASATEVMPEEEAVFSLYVGNMTETDEYGWYLIKPLPEFNPDGAIVRLNGDYDSDGFLLNIPPLQVAEIIMTVARGPQAYDYEDLKVAMFSQCEYELAQQGLNGFMPFVADTVSFSIHYQRPCTEVEISNPSDGWLLDEAAHDTLWITVQGYELNANFSEIKLQFRPANFIARQSNMNDDADFSIGVKKISPNVGIGISGPGDSPSKKARSEFVEEDAPANEFPNPEAGPLTWRIIGPELMAANGWTDVNPPKNRRDAGAPSLIRGSSDGDDIRNDTWINFLAIPYADLQMQYDAYGVEYIIVPWDVTNLDDGAYEIRAASTCVAGSDIAGSSAVLNGIIERYPPAVHGTPQPADGVLMPGDVIAISFNELIVCNSIVEADVFDLNNIGLYNAATGNLIDIDFTCYDNTIIIEPNVSNYIIENQTLRMSLTGIKDLYDNPLPEQVDWEFWVNRNPIAWSGGDVTVTKYEDETITVTRQLVNSGSSSMTFDFIDLEPNPARAMLQPPDWLTVSPTSGTVNPGSAQTITIQFSADLIGGLFEDSLFVRTVKGDEFITVNLANICYPPAWLVNPGDFQHTMTITGKLSIPGVIPSLETYVAAFVGAEVRGVKQVEYESAVDDTLVYLPVYSNLDSGERITIRAYDGMICNELGQLMDGFIFQANTVHGDPQNPAILNLGSEVITEYNFISGWNWFSLNATTADMAINTVLAEVPAAEGDLIKNQNQYSQYVPGFGWIGTLTIFDNETMYMTRLSQASGITLIGSPVDSDMHPITISPGWNWIAYQALNPQEINTALSSLTDLVTGDLIKNQVSYSQYVTTLGWLGSLDYLEPGQGYLLNTANSGTLVYPTGELLASGSPPGASNGIRQKKGAKDSVGGKNRNWPFNPALYEFNMTITGRLISPLEGQDVIFALVGDECRGVAEATYIEALDENRYFLMIYSNSPGETVTFRAFDADEETGIDLTESILFEANTVVGDVSEPFSWVHEAAGLDDDMTGLPHEFSLGQNFPNPFNPSTVISFQLPVDTMVKITVYNSVGQRVKTLVDGQWSAGYHTVAWNAANDTGQKVQSGVYFYRMTTANGFDETRKLLLLK